MQKSFLMLAMSFVFGTTAQAQGWEWAVKPMFDGVPLFSAWKDGLLVVDKQAKCGVINEMGQLLIPFQFFALEAMGEGLFAAQINEKDKWGIIDKTGRWIIQPTFENTEQFSEGLAAVEKNNKYGFIDKSGKWVIQPQFDYAEKFSEGLSKIIQNTKCGFIDKTGKWVIQPQFDGLGNFHTYFNLGLCKARLEKTSPWGFIDKTGKWVIQPQFDRIYTHFETANVAVVEINGKQGVIDKTGKWLVKPEYSTEYRYSQAIHLSKSGKYMLAIKTETYPSGITKKIYHLRDLSGKRMLTQYENLSEVSDDLFEYKDERGAGLVDILGNKVGGQNFQEIRPFNEELAMAQQNDNWGFIDKTGKWVIQPQFANAADFSEGLAKVYTAGGTRGFIDKNGNWVVQPELLDIRSGSTNSLIIACKDRYDCKYGIIDQTGKWIVQPQFHYVEAYRNGLFLVRVNRDAESGLGFIRLKQSK